MTLRVLICGLFALAVGPFAGTDAHAFAEKGTFPRASHADESSIVKLDQRLPFLEKAQDLGRLSPLGDLVVTFWLKFRDDEALQQGAEQVLRKGSPSYRHWMSVESFNKEFAPSAQDSAKVVSFLQSQGFSNVETDTRGHWVRGHADSSRVEQALSIEFHQYLFAGRKFRAATTPPSLPASIAASVLHIGGINQSFVQRGISKAERTGPANPAGGPNGTIPGGGYFDPKNCSIQKGGASFQSADGTVTSQFSGNVFGPDLSHLQAGESPECFYDPETIYTAYGMHGLYNQGWDGTDETIVVTGAFGTPTWELDLDTFSEKFHLPKPNFKVVNLGQPVSGPWNADQREWAAELSMDVQAAHAMAPGANIVAVAAASDDEDDLVAALDYVVNQRLGNTVSDSWSGLESLEDPTTMKAYDQILQEAALLGISFSFASGDNGDYFTYLGYTDVDFPSGPFVTMVGGVDLFLDSHVNISKQIGWGNNAPLISASLNDPTQSQNMANSPLSSVTGFFSDGSGGGVSRVYRKPWYQSYLSGSMRQLPDISFFGDLIFEFPFIASRFDASGNPMPGNFRLGTGDGTSLATPLFSGLWSIAVQAAGSPLGPASAMVYDLPSGAIADIKPFSSADNVTGTITVNGAASPYSALSLGGPETSSPFISTLFNAYPPFSAITNPSAQGYQWMVLTFGTDSSLEVKEGFDRVTGLGVPNPVEFVDAIAPQ